MFVFYSNPINYNICVNENNIQIKSKKFLRRSETVWLISHKGEFDSHCSRGSLHHSIFFCF